MPLIDKNLNYRQFSSDDLILVCNFLGMEYCTGTFVISKLLYLTLNMPRFIANLILYCVGSQKRIEFKHPIFNYDIKLNF